MTTPKLRLYDLLAPQFGAGFRFPDFIDAYLGVLTVEELQVATDDSGFVYTGVLAVFGEGGAAPQLRHSAPSGESFSLDDLRFRFRLTIPRTSGSNVIAGVATQIGNAGNAMSTSVLSPPSVVTDGLMLENLAAVMGDFGPLVAPSTDAITMAFRLELMLSGIFLHLGEEWRPAVHVPGEGIVLDPSPAHPDVRFYLPRIIVEYNQDQDLGAATQVQLRSWGGDFDVASDLGVLEFPRMEPPMAIHESGRVGFGIDRILLDLSQDSTPPEILAHAGVGDDWTGLYIRALRVFFTAGKDNYRCTISVEDALISFRGTVSFSASAELVNPDAFKIIASIYDGDRPAVDVRMPEARPDYQAAVDAPGEARVPDGCRVHVLFAGGTPPCAALVRLEGAPAGVKLRQDGSGADGLEKNFFPGGPLIELVLDDANTVGTALLTITGADSTPSPDEKVSAQAVRLTVVPRAALAATPGTTTTRAPATWALNDPASADEIVVLHVPAPFGVREVLRVQAPHLLEGGAGQYRLTPQGQPASGPAPLSGPITVDVPPDTSCLVEIDLAARPAVSEFFDLLFGYDRPLPQPTPTQQQTLTGHYLADFAGLTPTAEAYDGAYLQTPVPKTMSPSSLGGTAKLHAWLDRCASLALGSSVQISVDAYASWEKGVEAQGHNMALSQRRLDVAEAAINEYLNQNPTAPLVFTYNAVHGDDPAQNGLDLHALPANQTATDPGRYPPGPLGPRDREERDRVVVLRARFPERPGAHAEGTLSRPGTQQPAQPQPQPQSPGPPNPPNNLPPDVFRRAAIKARMEENDLVMLALELDVDFETALEKSMRDNGVTQPNQGPFLDATDDGVVKFSLAITYDPGTKMLTETFAAHAGEGDQNGLVEISNTSGTDEVKALRNALGAMMVLSPLLNAAQDDVDVTNGGQMALLAVSWAAPAAIGALNFFQTEKMTLFGAEARQAQYIGGPSPHFTDNGVLFDYGVSFRIDLTPIPLKSTQPMRVRYRAVGFNVHIPPGGGPALFQPILDTSRGYELDLRDPGLFALPSPLDDLLTVAGARLARFNPLTLELDLRPSLELGVVKIDEFKVKWPIWDEATETVGVPTIIPSAVTVDIPGVIVGSGALKVDDAGFAGSIDLTLRALKLRIAAGLAVQQLDDFKAVYASLNVDFPAPIVLGATGLGIFGLAGLFAMNYARDEGDGDSAPGDVGGPALAWLAKAGGNPARLFHNGVQLWKPEKGRWSFGVGVLLGTLEGGFLASLRGTLMLELPGPRILVCVNLKALQIPPDNTSPTVETDMLGVLDIDIAASKLTLGVLVNLEVQSLLEIRIPIELYFNWSQSSDWHLHLGRFDAPATCKILGIVDGGGYLMLQGGDLDIPIEYGPPIALGGPAVAAGVFATMVWGSKPAGLYLEVFARADLGFGFSPFHAVGLFYLRGTLHLWIIELEASAYLRLEVPPVFFVGRVCARVDLFFFELEGCVQIEFGSASTSPPPPLVQSVFLQSYAPVIVAGQGGDRPIDASLGDAPMLDSNGDLPQGAAVPVVPIDAVPVVRLLCSPLVGAAGESWKDGDGDPIAEQPTDTFSEALVASPGLAGDFTGTVELGNQRGRYILRKLELFRRPRGSNASWEQAAMPVVPPTVWRRRAQVSNGGADKQVDLAIGSRSPSHTPFALERSTELKGQITETFESVCIPGAPAAAILWTFAGKAVGPTGDGKGWQLEGLAWPDPPNTQRLQELDLGLKVGEGWMTDDESIANELAKNAGAPYFIPATVVGKVPQQLSELATLSRRRGLQLPRLGQKISTAPVPAPITAASNALRERMYVALNVGACGYVRLLVRVDTNFYENQFELVELDAHGVTLSSKNLSPQWCTVVTAASQLPSTWTNSTGPWVTNVTRVLELFDPANSPDLQNLVTVYAHHVPSPKCRTLLVRCKNNESLGKKQRTLVLGVVETLSQAELDRVTLTEELTDTIEETLKDYIELGEGGPPFLLPDSEYRLEVTHDYHGIEEVDLGQHLDPFESVVAETGIKQSFRFDTDKVPPQRLDPYVMATSPAQGERFCFYGDPIYVVFNDTGASDLFAAYGGKLTFQIRGADGTPVGPKSPDPTILDSLPVDLPLETQYGDIGSAYHDTLVQVAGTEALPCVNAEHTTVLQDVALITEQLAPLMDYTLDIQLEPLDGHPPLPVPPDQPTSFKLPFFRRSFGTGRYRDLEDFARAIRDTRADSRVLTQAIGLPGTGAVDDAAMQTALKNAGEDALPAPERNRVTVYWLAPGPGQAEQPYALLIDTDEPHWRSWTEATLVPGDPLDPNADPNFKRVELSQVPSLRLQGTGDAVARIVHAFGGARSLVFLDLDEAIVDPGDQTFQVSAALQRPSSDTFNNTATSETCLALRIPMTPPWREEG